MPPFVSDCAAYTPRTLATRSQTYAPRTKYGKEAETPRVFAGFSERWKTFSAMEATMQAASNKTVANRKPPRSATMMPEPEAHSAAMRPPLEGFRRPRKTGNHLALKPQTARTGKPQAARNK